MARKTILEDDRFTFKLYQRTLPKGKLYYVRFYEKDSTAVLADRSTGETDEGRATAAAGKLLGLLPLEKLAQAKTTQAAEHISKAERIKNMSFADFLVWFWDAKVSDYIKDRIDAEKPLAGAYIKNQYRYASKHAANYLPFTKTPLKEGLFRYSYG
jgi:hypothetical protein